MATKKKSRESTGDTPSAAADERKVVEPSESLHLPLDDQIQVWWEENRNSLVIGAIVALLIVGGFQSIRLYRMSYENKVQDAFQEARANDGLDSFISEFPRHDLAGVSHLQLAHEAYENEAYDEARERFRAAFDVLGDSALGLRARLGAAMASLQLGKRDEAVSIFETIADNPDLMQSARAEAAFHRAMIALEESQPNVFFEYYRLLDSLQFSDGWFSRLEAFRPDAEALGNQQ